MNSPTTGHSKYARKLGALAFCGAGIAAIVPVWAAPLLIWAAGSFLFTAVGYARRSSKHFGKSSIGSLPVFTRLVTAPSISLNSLILATRPSEANKLGDTSLYLGRRVVMRPNRSFEAVVDLTCEFTAAKWERQVTYFCAPQLDGVAPTQEELTTAVAAVRAAVREGPTLLHCAMGHGRTGTVAAAFLVDGGTEVEQALTAVRLARPGLELADEQAAAVREFARAARPHEKRSRDGGRQPEGAGNPE